MLPYIFIWNIKISLVGIGIVSSLIIFLLVSKSLSKKYNLQFSKFFFTFPYYFVIIYFLGKYIDYALITKDFIPSIKNILKIFSSYWEFHIVWIIIGICICIRISLYNKNKNESIKIIDMLFESGMYATIVLWWFLLFSDSFIWKSNEWWFAIKALVSYSRIIDIWTIYPLGIVLSATATVSLIISYLYKKWWGVAMWFFGFGIFFLLMNVVFYFQTYPKYLVVNLWWNIFDIKNYITSITGIVFLLINNNLNMKYRIKSRK